MNDNVLSIQPINFSKSCAILRRFLNAVLKMRCEQEMRADCSGNIENKLKPNGPLSTDRQEPTRGIAALACLLGVS